ncbi:MAG: insulinase family protein [Bdellovibrionales bacterium]|nr:insulinase family protein [Bdellovibrionales bacterium]
MVVQLALMAILLGSVPASAADPLLPDTHRTEPPGGDFKPDGSLVFPAQQKPKKIVEKPLPNGLKVHEYRMANGMRLLLVPDHSAPVVTYQVWFRVGAVDEQMDPRLNRTGLAHFFEHMMFRGTPKVPDGQFSSKISEIGGTKENATTWLERTNYFASVPKESLELLFNLESDRMANLIINEKLFDTERGAVLGELKMGKDKPARVMSEELWALAFQKHPYRSTTIGTEAELKSFTVEDAVYFYRKFYAPNNATLILLGDFQIPKALELAAKYYGPMLPQRIERVPSPAEPDQAEARRKEVTHPLATNEAVSLGFKIPAVSHPDGPAVYALAAVLSSGESSVLEQALVAKGLATKVAAGPYPIRDPGLFIVHADAAPGKTAEELEKVILEKIGEVGKISARDLRRAVNQSLLETYAEIKTLEGLGDFMGEALMSFDNYLFRFEELEKLKKVTLADLQRVTRQYLTAPRSNTILLRAGRK